MKKITLTPFTAAILILLTAVSCNDGNGKGILFFGGRKSDSMNDETRDTAKPGSYGYDAAFLKKFHPDAVELQDETGMARVLVLPAYQGRVMTSTAEGDAGMGFGWINHDLIASGRFTDHMSAFGGEERFWLGPEGGQFSIYFKKGQDFTFDNWHVPGVIDTIPFTLLESSRQEARFEKNMQLENRSGTRFSLKATRSIRLLDRDSIHAILGGSEKDLQVVGFESDNAILNTGTNTWDKQSGMLSIWILSMLNASHTTTIAIPYRAGDEKSLGQIVTDDYFGKVPADRLQVTEKIILMKADGNLRSKIGLSPKRAMPIAASYDSAAGVLTIAQFSMPEGAADYVNSLWEVQADPFSGDAVNAYNDGPINGKQMGRFYEIESSSPAAALKPGSSIRHLHRTIHVKGSTVQLSKISKRLLGVGIHQLKL